MIDRSCAAGLHASSWPVATIELGLASTAEVRDRAGMRPKVAAVYAGVGARSYYSWMELGRGANAGSVYIDFVEA